MSFTAFVNLSELLCPWLFFAPIRSLRIFAFFWQVFLQLCIIATGNYGFLSFLILAMLLSLLDDSHFRSNNSSNSVNYKKVFSFILTMLSIFFILVITMTFYKIKFVNGKLDVAIRKFMRSSFKRNLPDVFFNFSFQQNGILRYDSSNDKTITIHCYYFHH